MPDRARFWRLSGDGLQDEEVNDPCADFSCGSVDVVDGDVERASGNCGDSDIGFGIGESRAFGDKDDIADVHEGVGDCEGCDCQSGETGSVGGDSAGKLGECDAGAAVCDLGDCTACTGGIAETVGEWEKVLPGGVVSDSAELSFGDRLGDLFVESHIVVRLR